MKKIFLCVALAMISSSVFGASCFHGYKKNDFCFSDVKLNWWSAHTWCKAQEMHLATIYEACPYWTGGSNDCTAKYDVSFGSDTVKTWTATAKGDSSAYMLRNPTTGVVTTESRGEVAHALCSSKSTDE